MTRLIRTSLLHGVDLAPIGRTVEIGRKLAEYRAGITAKAFQESNKRLDGKRAESNVAREK